MNKLILAALPLAFVANPASAAVTFYTTQASFNAATTGAQPTDTFENAPTNSYADYSAGYVGSGFTVTGSSNYLLNVDPGYSPSLYDWGSGDVMLYAQNGTATFTFTSPVTAFSIDLMSILGYGATITVAGASFTTPIVTNNYPTRTFFGLTSDTGITGFTLTANGGYGEFDNFTIATAATGSVPEPATWALMLMGFGGLGYAMRRRASVTTRIRFA